MPFPFFSQSSRFGRCIDRERIEVRTTRWSQPFFPTRMVSGDEGVEVYRQKWWIHSWRKFVEYSDIASISMSDGLVFANVALETKGGEYLVIRGAWKTSARNFYERVKNRMRAEG